jgi:hypothetical protein
LERRIHKEINMKTEGLAQRWIANLSILLVIAFFCFLSIGLANAGSYTYTLSGGPSSETPLIVDDDLEVRVNEKIVFIDNDHVSTHDGRAIWKGEPITFSASHGDVLRIIATNPGGVDIELSPLYLHVNGQSLKLSDGVPNTRREEHGEFFNVSFTISIPAPKIVITNPKEGEKITWSPEGYLAKGTYSGSENGFNIYLIVHPLTTSQWWVQSTPDFSDVTWNAKVFFGTEELGAGEDYELYAIITDEVLNEGLIEKLPAYVAKSEVKVSRVESTPLISWEYLYVVVIAMVLILLPFIAYRKGKKRPKPPEEIGKKAQKEVKIPEPEEGREKLNFPENKIKQHEAPISEPEDMEGVLKGTYPEKEAARLASAFRIAQDIRNNYCDTNTKAKDINKEFDLLKMYLTEREFLDEIEGIQRKINAELREDERLDEKHVEEVKDFCEKFTEMWIARFLR